MTLSTALRAVLPISWANIKAQRDTFWLLGCRKIFLCVFKCIKNKFHANFP